jgi:hypothetical protein
MWGTMRRAAAGGEACGSIDPREGGSMDVAFDAELWIYPGDAGWHFVTLPIDVSDEIRDRTPPRRGFGSVRVEATVGEVTWKTSLFPQSKSGSFVLPVKKDVRRRNDLEPGDVARVQLTILDTDA